MSKTIIYLLGFLVLSSCLSPQTENFDWLVGQWLRTNDTQGQFTFETWKKENEQLYTARSYTIENYDTVWQETIELGKEGKQWQFSVHAPQSESATIFNLDHIEQNHFVCTNPENEFPTQITYTRSGDSLIAIISKDKNRIPFNFTPLEEHNIKVNMETPLGVIAFELYPYKAPLCCANFVKYIENQKLNDAHFYRVVHQDNQPNNEIKIEVVQWGLGFDVIDYVYPPIAHETTLQTGILHKNGTLSMARAEPGTASSEFFICIGDQPDLDYGGLRNPDKLGFAAFGRVVEGMQIVKEIQQMPDSKQMLNKTIPINSIKKSN